MSELSKLLQQADRRNPMTTRERAKRIDGRIHFATLAKYQAGTHPARPDETTLRALADAYDVPYAKIQRAAGVPVGAGPYQPPAEAARLTRREQEAITELIKAIAAGKGESDAGSSGQKIEYGVGDSPESATTLRTDEGDAAVTEGTYDPDLTSGEAIHRTRGRRSDKQPSKGRTRRPK